MLNDGTSMLFFALFLDLAKGNSTSFTGLIGSFVRISVGGPILGIFLGMIAAFWMKRIIRDNVLIVTVTVVLAYLCFYIA